MEDGRKKCGDDAGLLIAGVILVGMGTLFLLITLDVIPGWKYVWPAIIILVGAAMIIGTFCKKKNGGAN